MLWILVYFGALILTGYVAARRSRRAWVWVACSVLSTVIVVMAVPIVAAMVTSPLDPTVPPSVHELLQNRQADELTTVVTALAVMVQVGYLLAVCFAKRISTLIAEGHEVTGYRKCPFCAEAIRAEAIRCRHCGTDLLTTPPPATPRRGPLYIDPADRI